MLFPLIGARLHGWLDDLVTLTYIAGAWLLGLHGVALAVALAGAGVHFLLTRLTDYPQGQLRLLSFRQHAFVELGEGLGVLAVTLGLLGQAPDAHTQPQLLFLGLLGTSQLGAFAFSDYRQP